MLSKLRRSFRRKSSRSLHHHHRPRNDDFASAADSSAVDTDTESARYTSLPSQSVSSSLTSLSSFRSGELSGSARSLLKGGAAQRSAPAHPDSQWQRATPSVVECNRTMFNRQLNCDVVFVVGGRRALVGAHRFVLLSRSDVFYRMFCGPMAESGPVVIPDVTEDVFRQFLE